MSLFLAELRKVWGNRLFPLLLAVLVEGDVHQHAGVVLDRYLRTVHRRGERLAVDLGARQGREQETRLHLAAVGGDAGDERIDLQATLDQG